MTTAPSNETPLYLPTREDPAINQLFDNAAPCPDCGAGQQSLWPVQSAEREGVYAIMCDCGHIGGDGTSVPEAIVKWNSEACPATTQPPRR